MIERHVTFLVIPGKEEEFERLFKEEYSLAMSSMPGFVNVHLLADSNDPQRYRMVIRFHTSEEASAWRSSLAHQNLQPKIKALYRESQAEEYRVIA